MRIRSARIASYGRFHDRSFGFSEGITVYHGPNESGKTTLMEFLRNTLVPTGKRDIYPERRKTDSGEVIVDDDGIERRVTLSYKTRGGDVPMCISGMDPELYRGIYALSSKDLEDGKAVSSDEISRRYLTVPGGSGMPKAMESVSDMVDQKVGKVSKSPSEVNRIEGELAGLRMTIAEQRMRAGTYGDIVAEEESLRGELAEIRSRAEEDSARDRRNQLLMSQQQNLQCLTGLESRRSQMGAFITVTDEDEYEHRRLALIIEGAEGRVNDAKDKVERDRKMMGGVDPNSVIGHSEAIEAVHRELHGYLSRSTGTKHAGDASGGGRGLEHGRVPNITVAGVLIALAGLVGASITPFALTLVAAGSAIAVYGLMPGRRNSPGRHDRAVTGTEPDDWSVYETAVSRLMSDLGAVPVDTASDAERLSRLLDIARKCIQSEGDLKESINASNKANSDMLLFCRRFGGEEGFDRNLEKTREASDLDREMDVLRRAIRSAGLDPDARDAQVEKTTDTHDDQNEISRRLGELEEKRRSVLDTTDLDANLDRESALVSRRREALRQGAVALLAMHIAEAACEDIYGNVRPGVVRTADRYLSMMTDGTYRIGIDPRSSDLTVESSDGAKASKQWSTGLQAQVMLSLKLAIARELGNGEVPVILDDVLLPFDTRRKMGAIRALDEVSSEMQVILFTCDDQVRDMAASMGIHVEEL